MNNIDTALHIHHLLSACTTPQVLESHYGGGISREKYMHPAYGFIVHISGDLPEDETGALYWIDHFGVIGNILRTLYLHEIHATASLGNQQAIIRKIMKKCSQKNSDSGV